MKLIRFNEPSSFLRDWDAFFADPYRAFAPLFGSSLSSAREAVLPSVEWYEDDENYYAQVDLPGFRREDVRLDAEDGLLRVSYESDSEDERSDKGERVLRTPDGVDLSQACATLEHGVPRIALPKSDHARPVRIEVK